MIKVFISKSANDGILRVIEAQYEHLPKFGIQPTENIEEADIICNHGTMLDERPGVPSVAICHGMYWSRQPWDDGFQDVNRGVVETMRHAVAWTAPSEWVNRAIRRGGFWYPEVVYHGVDGDKFVPSNTHEDYVLWNKARADLVSNPNDMMHLAEFMPNREFRSTIGYASKNLKILKPMPHLEMKQTVSQAGVYLSTARETFGIGTLEALAYGVPVAGWRWGGTEEIIIQGETGYLATPGDYQELSECVELCYAHRERLSKNAIEDARTRWKWEPRIQQYADIFKRVYAKWYTQTPKVSVIVTAYKLDKFLPQCLDSIMRQTYKDFECLVVDDALSESTKAIVGEYEKRDNRIRYITPPQNLGLPGARNFGLSRSVGKYIRHLDADDFLADNALGLETNALDEDRGIDIVYGHLEVVRTDGSRVVQNGEPVRSGWPEDKFNWYRQMAHLNQLPSCVMARREVYERSGGYRERMKRNEDAEFWCRVTSLGFRAKKFTQAVTYYHRERNDSKGVVEWSTEGSEPDWTAWFPWRMGAKDYNEAQSILRKRGERPRNSLLVPFGAQGEPPRDLRFWHIHDYSYPVVSIIVTCGPGHKKYLIDALDSIQAQNYPDWECIVVNDTGEEWDSDLIGAPWAKVVNMDGNRGASEARNEGYKHIHPSSKYVVWMDADDYWMPWFLEKMVIYSEANPNGVIYSDFIMQEDEKTFKPWKYAINFNPESLHAGCATPGTSILIPRNIAQVIFDKHGGWDTNIQGIEDWEFQFKICAEGFCFFHISEPMFVYRMYSSTKRNEDYNKVDEIIVYMDNKWISPHKKGEFKMCGCQSTKKPITNKTSSTFSSSGDYSASSVSFSGEEIGDNNQPVTVQYVGPVVETFTIKSRVSRDVSYRFGNNDNHRFRSVFRGDAEWLTGFTDDKGKPTYIILGNSMPQELEDPAEFIGNSVLG